MYNWLQNDTVTYNLCSKICFSSNKNLFRQMIKCSTNPSILNVGLIVHSGCIERGAHVKRIEADRPPHPVGLYITEDKGNLPDNIIQGNW